MAEQRHRSCPECDAERPAVEFVSVPYEQRPSTARGPWMRCSSCGHIGPKFAFKLVNLPAPPGQVAGPNRERRRLMPTCRSTRADGGPCGHLAKQGTAYCWLHGPAELRKMP